MKFFVDTAMIDEIKELESTGLLDGVTTNPSLIKKSGRPFDEVIKEICATVEGPVSAEVVAIDHKTMLLEAQQLAAIAPNIAVKVPMTVDGLKTCKAMRDERLFPGQSGQAFGARHAGRSADVCQRSL